jgi:hypothetical protein
MAEITAKDLKSFPPLKLEDYRQLEKITRKKKLKKGIDGYSAMQIRNFVMYGHYCTAEMKQEIINYLSGKKELNQTV